MCLDSISHLLGMVNFKTTIMEFLDVPQEVRTIEILSRKYFQSFYFAREKRDMASTVKIGIIGGTGLDQDPEIIESRKEGIISTPFGKFS